MHAKAITEKAGTFTDSKTVMLYCSSCGTKTPHEEATWESSCGGYEDYKFTCSVCDKVSWVDGPDS